MADLLSAHQELMIDGVLFRVARHPSAGGDIAFGQERNEGTVYRLEAGAEARALKVFHPRNRDPRAIRVAAALEQLAWMPGMMVARRTVITPTQNSELLARHPELTYAVLMPWIEGLSWSSNVVYRQALTEQDSAFLASSLAECLAALEEQEVSHCDLSGDNLMMSRLVAGPTSRLQAELVDLDQIFMPSLPAPDRMPRGSPGYVRASTSRGAWHAKVARYSGAVLLAEILGWCEPKVLESSSDDCFFAPGELGTVSARFRVLRSALADHWSATVAQLFEDAWRTPSPSHCPTLAEWLSTIRAAAGDELNARDRMRLSLDQWRGPAPVPMVMSSGLGSRRGDTPTFTGSITGAAICRRGHVEVAQLNAFRDRVPPRCPACGARILVLCPQCQARIRGQRRDVDSSYVAPNFCDECGRPFPWVTRDVLLLHAENRLDEESDLTDAEREALKEELAVLARAHDGERGIEQKRTTALSRLSRLAPKVWDVVRPVMTDVVTAAAKGQLGLS